MSQTTTTPQDSTSQGGTFPGNTSKGTAFVLHAHPCKDSFNAALYERTLESLKTGGWDVDACDLYAEEFDPVLSRVDREEYHDLEINRRRVEPYVERLQNARALIFVYPVWNYGFPAILKGFIDRVFLPGVSFHLEETAPDKVKLTRALSNIDRLATVTTYGGDRLRTFLAGDPPRKYMMRTMRATVGLTARARYLALHDLNNVDQTGREAFLNKVGREIQSL
ncbi:MAG: NAD(P)H-dependent oxidoreductase [Pseudomonadota bacterium]